MIKICDSKRLSYRLFDLSNTENCKQDIQDMWHLEQDPDVMKYITKGITTSKEVMEKVFVPRIKSYTYPEQGYGMWRVSIKHTDEFIGEIIARPMGFFTNTPNFDDIELGWRFYKAHWGRGYATESALHVMHYIENKNQVNYFTAMADSDNASSIYVMKKLGMMFIKNTTHSDPLGDAKVDIYQRKIN